jgi:hypothetical protein
MCIAESIPGTMITQGEGFIEIAREAIRAEQPEASGYNKYPFRM